MSTNVPISSVTLTEATSSIIFSGIPQTYTDLFIVADGYNNTGDFYTTIIRFNGDSASNYSRTRFVGDGSSVSNSRLTNQTGATINSAGGWGLNNNGSGNIPNYSNTTTFKTILSRSNTAATAVELNLLTWRSTSAITSIEMFTSSATYRAGSTFNLYGINSQKSEQAKATGGDSIYRDSSYWYHIFNKSGTFTPSQSLSNVDYLVVAGGGGGGRGAYGMGGGGGAGGLRSTVTTTGGGGSLESSLSLSAQSYTVTVGAGGAGGAGSGTSGINGSNSTISTITSTGGGGGGGSGYTSPDKDGKNGGSGGGGAGQTGASGTGGQGTANQGYAGGNAPAGSPGAGGGGGGGAGAAGATGGTGNSGAGGNGGNGVSVAILGSSTTYAGGGGGSSEAGSGGNGGTGGGGSGGSGSGGNGSSGTANLGAGGGSGFSSQGNGGSGIIIVRYPV
jgi:hypothetical protein